MEGQAQSFGAIPFEFVQRKIFCNWNGQYEEAILANNVI